MQATRKRRKEAKSVRRLPARGAKADAQTFGTDKDALALESSKVKYYKLQIDLSPQNMGVGLSLFTFRAF